MIVQLILLFIISSVSSQLLHHAMTSEELGQIFSVESISEVPNYDIMPISVLKPRNRRGVKSYLMTKPFDAKNLRIWLHPTDGTLISKNAPICTLRSTNDNKTSMFCYKDLHKHLKTYENINHATTVSIDKNSRGKHSVKGFIGRKYIHPVPPHLIDHARRHRRSVDKSFERESDDEVYHILYDIPQSHEDMLSSPLRHTRAAEWTYNQPIKVPDTIYPEILVIVDYRWYRIVRQISIIDKLKYLIAFWNGVDLRYRSLNNPKVRLNIVRIVFAMDKKVLSYMGSYENFDPTNKISTMRDSFSALRNKGNWLYNLNEIIPIRSYDLAVTMLTDNMCSYDSKSKSFECSIIGLAYPSGACDINNVYNTTDKVAFVQDFGNYWGIHSAAHELGHLFGIEHDNKTVNGCVNENGYIMGTSNFKTENSFDWSKCSISQMDKFLKSEKAECLFNEPLDKDQSFRRYLPGRIMPITTQCKYFWNAELSNEYKMGVNCREVLCKRESDDYLVSIEPAEGSTCGHKKICIHGQCLSEKLIE